MRPALIGVLAFICCSAPMMTTDGGTDGGGSGGGAGGSAGGAAGGSAGGGTGGGRVCVPNCPCGNTGGGSIAIFDRVVLASRTSDAGPASVTLFDRTSILDGPAEPQPLLSGEPVAVAGGPYSIYAIKSGTTPAQHWFGNLTGCDPPEDLPGIDRAIGEAQLSAAALWYARAPGEIVRFVGAQGTVFAEPGATLTRFAFDSATGRLFATGMGGTAIDVWLDAGARTGDAGAPDFQLAVDGAGALVVAGDLLYAATTSGNVRAWTGIGALTAARPSDFSLTTDAGGLVHESVYDGGLVVTASSGRVLIYRAPVTSDRPPDSVIADAALVGASKATLGIPNTSPALPGSLFVLTPRGVAVIKDPLGSPSISRVLRGTGEPVDMAYLP